MRLSLTNVKNLDLGDKHLVARFELINPNDDEFQVSLICASAEGVVVDGKIKEYQQRSKFSATAMQTEIWKS